MKRMVSFESAYYAIVVIFGVFSYIMVSTGRLELGVGIFSVAATYLAIGITIFYYKRASQQLYDYTVKIALRIDNHFIKINRKIDNLDKKIEKLKPKKKTS